MRLAMKMILAKQRHLERMLVVRNKQLKAMQTKKVAKGMAMRLSRRTVRQLKSLHRHKKVAQSAPKFKLFKATRFSRMKAAFKQAQYETRHLRRVLSIRTHQLRSLKTVSRKKEDVMKQAMDKLKSNNYNYGSTKFPEACACNMLTPNKNSKCYYFTDATKTTCTYRQCRATYVCTTDTVSGLICMRRKKTSKLVVGTTTVGTTQCSSIATSGYVYVPYTNYR